MIDLEREQRREFPTSDVVGKEGSLALVVEEEEQQCRRASAEEEEEEEAVGDSGPQNLPEIAKLQIQLATGTPQNQKATAI